MAAITYRFRWDGASFGWNVPNGVSPLQPLLASRPTRQGEFVHVDVLTDDAFPGSDLAEVLDVMGLTLVATNPPPLQPTKKLVEFLADYAVQPFDEILVDAGHGVPVTVSLPALASVANGRPLVVKASSTTSALNPITVAAGAGTSIEGGPNSIALTAPLSTLTIAFSEASARWVVL